MASYCSLNSIETGERKRKKVPEFNAKRLNTYLLLGGFIILEKNDWSHLVISVSVYTSFSAPASLLFNQDGETRRLPT